jgi:fatty acid amide hydrolase
MTIKECYDIKGLPTTGGMVRFANQRVPVDSPMVARLRAAGAIFLGKTNLPQLMLFNEGDNPLFGRTNNPWNLERSPGGGSSGEGAILAAGGSPVGLASDYGGSVRIPPHFCGIHGFKPTSGRLSLKGTFDARLFSGMETVIDQPGPMGRNVEDLRLVLSVIAAPGLEKIDRTVRVMPWRDPADVSIKDLKIAWYDDDRAFRPAPAVRRVTRDAAAVLEGLGAFVEEWVPGDIERGRAIFLGLASAAGSRWAKRIAGDDKLDKRAGHPVMAGGLPNWAARAGAAVLRRLGQHRLASFAQSVGVRSTADYWDLILERDRYMDNFAAVMDAKGYDVILCPPNPFPAYRHGTGYYLTNEGSYTQVYNLLGMPTGAVAVSRIGPDEECDRPESTDLIERTARAGEIGSVGLPVGVQVVARHWREDVAFAVMDTLEQHFKTRDDYPLRPPL